MFYVHNPATIYLRLLNLLPDSQSEWSPVRSMTCDVFLSAHLLQFHPEQNAPNTNPACNKIDIKVDGRCKQNCTQRGIIESNEFKAQRPPETLPIPLVSKSMAETDQQGDARCPTRENWFLVLWGGRTLVLVILLVLSKSVVFSSLDDRPSFPNA